PPRGARKAIRVPSGLMRTMTRSGLANIRRRDSSCGLSCFVKRRLPAAGRLVVVDRHRSDLLAKMTVEETDQRSQQLPFAVRRLGLQRGGERAVVTALQVDPAGIGRMGPPLAARLLGARPMKRAAAPAPQLELLADEKLEQVVAS